jgi:adenylate kinase family enzyme
VKCTTSHDFYVQNIGKCPASFTLHVSAPFSVTPNEVPNLNVGEGVQIIVSFTPDCIMQFAADLMIQFTNGDIQTTALDGSAMNTNVRLDSTLKELPDTFVSEVSQTTFKIVNKSDIRVKYIWKLFATEEDENRHKQRKINQLSHEYEEGSRPYRKSKREIESDDMNFVNKNFSIYPLSGEIWPGMDEYITIDFHPKAEAIFENIAFCDVTGRENRLPIKITGRGKGPDAAFSFSDLNVGEVFVNAPHEYEIQLDNKGTIPAQFELLPSFSLFGSKFKFTPDQGDLAPCSSQTIKIEFNCDVIGEFVEIFRWRIGGKTDELTVCFSGQVVGPLFHFGSECVDFGVVSFNFLNTAYVDLINACEIPMQFRLRVPEDGTMLNREFDIIPSSGTVLPESTKQIKIEFLSNTLKTYNSTLVVDVVDVGEGLLSIPIRAECVVPEILLSSGKINFGDCFLGYTYTQTLDLGNSSNLPAKYEVILPRGEDNAKVTCTVDGMKGVVPSNSTHKIKVSIVTKEVGNVYIPLYVRIVGSEKPPFEVSISACAIGPIVTLDTQKLEWGKVQVLEQHEKQLKIINKSPIPAPFTLQFNSKNSLFSCDISSGSVPPTSEMQLIIKVRPDESMKFKDTLVVNIQNGEQIPVQLVAIGIGSSITASVPLDVVNFENVFTSIPCEIKFILVNQGRKTQTLQWMPQRKKNESPSDIVFKVTPERINLAPKTQQEYTITGFSAKEGNFVENFICKSTGKGQKVIYETSIEASFTVPLTKLSANKLSFEYIYSQENPPVTQSQPLVITSVSPLPLNITLKLQSGPFELKKTEYTIPKDESITVDVLFNPNYKQDHLSANLKCRLIICYKDHPQKDNLDLVASINFPNIDLPSNGVDFGTVMNETEKYKELILTNSGLVDATYNWILHLQEEDKSDDNVHIVNVFDVLPIRGIVKAGEQATVQFGFNSHSNGTFKCSAICQIQGGPEYEVLLRGESSVIKYSLDTQEIDFGVIPFSDLEEKEIVLVNSGRVMFSYEFDISNISVSNRLEIIPSSGKLKGGEKQKFIVRFFPAIPESIEETFNLIISNFDPIVMTVHGIAVYPTVTTSLDLSETEQYSQYLKDVRDTEDPTLNEMALTRVKEPTGRKTPSKNLALTVSPDVVKSKEAERLLFRDYLLKNPLSYKPSSKRGNRPSSSRASNASRFSLLSRHIESKFVLTRYCCDFGTTIKGMSRKKNFKISNVGLLPISFKFDKRELAKSGLTIEPLEIKKLPGYPDYTSLELTLTFQSKHKKANLGEYSVVIPMEVVNGYIVEFEVKANIIIPEVEVSMTNIDFGSLYLGYCKIVTVQLHNQKDIPCEWFIDERPKTVTHRAPSREQQPPQEQQPFVTKIRKGTLQPGERFNVEVSFIPSEKKKYNANLAFKVTHNPKAKKITCTGIGKEVELSVEPSELELGPVLPHTDSDVPITITNSSDGPLELYSIDFDAKYLDEEEMLMAAPGYENGFLLIPPRNPGEPLPDFVIKAYQQAQIKKDGVVIEEVKEETKETTGEEISMSSNTPSVTIPPENRKIFVIHGPPLSGQTTFANALSEKVGLPVLYIDSILSTVLVTEEVPPVDTNTATPTTRPSTSSSSTNVRNEENTSVNNNEGEVDSQVASIEHPSIEQQLLECISKRIAEPDCARGFIIDSLYSKEINNNIAVAEVLVRACHPSPVLFIGLTLNEVTVRLRELIFREDEVRNNMEEARVPELTEDEFDQLSNEEKEKLEHSLRTFRILKAEMQQILDEKSKLIEEELQSGQDVISMMKSKIEDDKKWRMQIEEERKRKKKPLKRGSVPPTPDLQAPPSFEELTTVYDGDDELTIRMKIYKSSFFIVLGIFERGYKTEQEIEQEREAEAKKKKQPNARKAQTEEVINTPPPKIFIITSDVPSDNMVQQLSEKIHFPLEDDSPKEDLNPTLEIPEAFVLQRIEMPVPRKQSSIKLFKLMQEANSERKESTRWVIPENSSLQLFVRFCSPKVGVFESMLQLGLTGRKLKFKIKCRGVCNYPEISTFYRSIFPRRIKQRVENKTVSKKYIVNEKIFEYGPLLIRDSYREFKLSTDNGKYFESFHFTNNGLFDAQVSFALKNESNSSNFEFEPPSVVIPRDQSVDVRLWTMPRTTGKIQNTVVCLIKDNPTPFTFDVQVTGAEPQVEVSKHVIDFGRLLLSSNTTTEVFTIKNITTIPVKWKIVDNVEKALSEEFMIEPREQKLEIGESVDVTVKFTSKTPCALKDFVTIEVSDEDEVKRPEHIKLAIQAESFNLEAKVDSELNFGTVRAVDAVTKTLQLSNSGKYDINYTFNIPKSLSRFFTFKPQSGVLETKAKNPTNIVVQFQTTQEKKLKNCTDITCSLTDAKTQEALGTTKLNINIEAVFSKFSIVPMHGINFGPLNFDKEKTRQMEITNEGPHPFTYTLFSFKEKDEPPVPTRSTSSAANTRRPNSKRSGPIQPNKNKKKDKGKKELQLGRFLLEPYTGELPPGAKEKINVTFSGEGSEIYREILGIEISGRDVTDSPKGIQFDLQGESCMPGIMTSDFESIFEEQQLTSSVNLLAGNQYSVFCVDERVFSFGTHHAGKKVPEKIKIINPYKVPCNIECSIKPRDASESSSAAAFDVQPQKIFVPAHEHRYVTVYFEPPSLQTYSAIFDASVSDGQDIKTNNLRFEIRGDGSLPQVVVKQPEASENGQPILRFPRTMVGRKVELPIEIQNEGTLNATVRFDFKLHPALTFKERSKEIILQSKVTKAHNDIRTKKTRKD